MYSCDPPPPNKDSEVALSDWDDVSRTAAGSYQWLLGVH